MRSVDPLVVSSAPARPIVLQVVAVSRTFARDFRWMICPSLDICRLGIYYGMARVQTASDAFAAIAEPRRREPSTCFAQCDARDLDRVAPTKNAQPPISTLPVPERDVTWFVETPGWPQPQVPKHLGVLRRPASSASYAKADAACMPASTATTSALFTSGSRTTSRFGITNVPHQGPR